jgi:hypothetical protein
VEAECPFISYNDLLDRLEHLVCDVVQRVLDSPHGEIVRELNPVSDTCLVLTDIGYNRPTLCTDYYLVRLLHVSTLMCHLQGASFILVSY